MLPGGMLDAPLGVLISPPAGKELGAGFDAELAPPRDSVTFASSYTVSGGPESALESRRQLMKDNQRTILVFEVTHDQKSGIRRMSRRELLEEARRTSTPLRLRPAPGKPPPKLTGNDALLKARDVRKVDPLFAGRLEPVIFVRCGSITGRRFEHVTVFGSFSFGNSPPIPIYLGLKGAPYPNQRRNVHAVCSQLDGVARVNPTEECTIA